MHVVVRPGQTYTTNPQTANKILKAFPISVTESVTSLSDKRSDETKFLQNTNTGGTYLDIQFLGKFPGNK